MIVAWPSILLITWDDLFVILAWLGWKPPQINMVIEWNARQDEMNWNEFHNQVLVVDVQP